MHGHPAHHIGIILIAKIVFAEVGSVFTMVGSFDVIILISIKISF